MNGRKDWLAALTPRMRLDSTLLLNMKNKKDI